MDIVVDLSISIYQICLYISTHRYEYKLTKEYNWNVKNKASKGYEVGMMVQW